MPSDLDRRGVLAGSAAAAAAASLAGPGHTAAPAKPYRVGVIGCGWFGKWDLNALLQLAPARVVALCDVDRRMLEQARDLTMARTGADTITPQTEAPALYGDYRKMLAAHAFDIVIVGTPDHWHALPAKAALEAGAHVYLEKPITVDVREGQALVAAARAHGRVVQVNTQRRSLPHLIEARDKVIRPGRLGTVGLVEMFGYFHQRQRSFPPDTAPPAGLDWDTYCGPAPLLPYNPGVHPLNWRSFKRFGNGYMGDIGVHYIDAVRWMMDLGWPRRITSSAGIFVDRASAADIPDTQMATFEFDRLMVTWTNRQWGDPVDGACPWGAAFYGDKGTLKIATGRYDFTPAGGGAGLSGEMKSQLDRYPSEKAMQAWEHELMGANRWQMADFLRAVETGGRPACDIEQGHISTSCAILANLSADLGRPINWDAAAQAVIGDPEANARLERPYRAPWTHPRSA